MFAEEWAEFRNNRGFLAVVAACERLCELRGAPPLPEREQWIRKQCRARFGLYDPSSIRQAQFIERIERIEATGSSNDKQIGLWADAAG